MVMKMNKARFIDELSSKINLSKEECFKVNDILEKNFFISKKNKDKIITEISTELQLDLITSTKIYEESISIIKKEITTKLKHPFGENKE